MSEPTFRDFAAAAMSGKTDDATTVLGELLGLDEAAAGAATVHFQDQAKTVGQPFIMKAMGLRQAVTAPDDAPARELVAACFGLDGDTLARAVTTLRRRHA